MPLTTAVTAVPVTAVVSGLVIVGGPAVISDLSLSAVSCGVQLAVPTVADGEHGPAPGRGTFDVAALIVVPL